MNQICIPILIAYQIALELKLIRIDNSAPFWSKKQSKRTNGSQDTWEGTNLTLKEAIKDVNIYFKF